MKLIERENLPSEPIIGFQLQNTSKGWLQPMDDGPTKYRAMCARNGVKNCNGWTQAGETLDDFFKWADKYGIMDKVFLFETSFELFRWLGEE